MASPAGACSDARLWRSARGRGSAGPRTRSGRPRPVEQHELASRGSYQSDVPRRHLQRLTTPFSDPLPLRADLARSAAAGERAALVDLVGALGG